MAPISPINDALNAPSTAPLVLPPQNYAVSTPTLSTTSSAAAGATPLTDAATTQPLNLVYDALANAGLDSALDETLFAPPTVQASGAFANFMDQLFAAIAAQQAATEQAEAVQAKAARGAATAAAAAAQPTEATATVEAAATTPAATAAAAFASNTASAAPNSALESNVQALANQAQAAYTATESTSALLPLQQSFDEFIASAGGTTSTAALPNFLDALATNLHTVPTPLGNLVDSLI
jgi:hypothetical protein